MESCWGSKSPEKRVMHGRTTKRRQERKAQERIKRAEKGINGLKDPKYNYFTPIASPTPSYVSTHNYSLSPRLSSAFSIEITKEQPLPPQLKVVIKSEGNQRVLVAQECWSYYNREQRSFQRQKKPMRMKNKIQYIENPKEFSIEAESKRI
ncbi:hypothetical protein C1646_766566 [Rhizophagus diaphanus]|nr:hypothetical protein C1646_766566 [Rhizophagus diaphanus] [Rhizophagus sp. MUCL 43196]